jgi:TatD DNase family protein
MRYINLHCHKKATGGKFEVVNQIVGADNTEILSPDSLYSAGIHPWYTENINKSKEILNSLIIQPNIIAVGECGFDPKSILSLSEQEQLFIFQAQLAEKYHKPLIIHCVKWINELIRVKKNVKPTVPWIIHGFSSNRQTLMECLKYGFYYSVGHQLLQSNSNISSIISEIPIRNLFFETDESTTSISRIYSHYSLITGISPEEVCEKIYTNFVRNFLIDYGNG